MIHKLLLLILFSFSNISAQQYRSSIKQNTLMKADQFIASLHAVNSVADREGNHAVLRVEQLLKDLQPSIYLLSGTVKVYGENPVCLFTDTLSLKELNSRLTSDLHVNDIEMVTIRIDNIAAVPSGIDLSVFANFQKLKYIYLLVKGNSTAESIFMLIKNNDPKYHVFYNLEKGS